ncbi:MULTISPECIES: hypothetical protein [Sodalis]|uniref:hypothetical protein n=1 Tax=Sodalis TaxID=84565 RepID=UPI001052E713|nr:hypothetical protein [Sodalis ligni]
MSIVWRWREACQHGFAARMDWAIKDFAHANPNPVVVVNNRPGKGTIYLHIQYTNYTWSIRRAFKLLKQVRDFELRYRKALLSKVKACVCCFPLG